MRKYTYTPKGVCSTKISFEINAGILRNVQFKGGCSGNLQAISKLVEGMHIEDVLLKLKGIDCAGRGTSCSDQLTKAVENCHQQEGRKVTDKSHARE